MSNINQLVQEFLDIPATIGGTVGVNVGSQAASKGKEEKMPAYLGGLTGGLAGTMASRRLLYKHAPELAENPLIRGATSGVGALIGGFGGSKLGQKLSKDDNDSKRN
jgi:uncharacterized membrane protein YfcA